MVPGAFVYLSRRVKRSLNRVIRDKHSESGADERHLFGASEMQGWRINMEDAHTLLLKLEGGNNAFFGVYDGHGGSSAAKFSGEHVPKRLASEEAYKSEDYKLALKKAFLGTDEDLRSDSNFFRDPSGCTAVVALITTDDKIYVANAGDSRSVLGTKGEAKPLSFDHKPQNEGESSRIRAAGGFVEYGRVNGNLALSRAIGDFEFKSNQSLEPEKQIVTSDPEITVHEPTEDDEFLVIACDGIWDCLTSQQVVDIVRRLIAEKKELDQICEVIMDKCLAPDSDINGGVGCDNMTVVIVGLLRGRTKEEWYNWIADRVEKKVGYETPKELPQLYSASRVAAAKERWSAPRNQFTRPNPTGLSNLARVFGTNIMFHPSGGISSNGVLDQDDSSEEYESEEGEHEGNAGGSSLQAPPSKDPNKALREQLEKLKEDGEGEEGEGKWSIDEDGDSQMEDQSGAESTPTIAKSTIFNRRIGGKNSRQNPDTKSKDELEIDSPVEPTKLPVGLSAAPPVSIGKPLIRSPPAISTPETKPKELQGEAPPPPKVNGVVKHEPEEQTKPEPAGDQPLSKATKGDGLLDKSEGPALVKSE
ncbi:Protein phosphatase 2C 2 [Tulasnella sp. 417]|nr:Protein phosphatase 2C 2 [Tulasnella sp. 417]